MRSPTPLAARDRADEHYARAIDLAHSSGATFVVGIASVGLPDSAANAGHVDDALRGYRDLIDYWDRSGNWTQQWVTLRNLAQLLRRLGDDEPAALLDAAAEQAPDAPATNVPADAPAAVAASTRPRVPPRPPTVSRARALETARQTIHDRLTESATKPRSTPTPDAVTKSPGTP